MVGALSPSVAELAVWVTQWERLGLLVLRQYLGLVESVRLQVGC